MPFRRWPKRFEFDADCGICRELRCGVPVRGSRFVDGPAREAIGSTSRGTGAGKTHAARAPRVIWTTIWELRFPRVNRNFPDWPGGAGRIDSLPYHGYCANIHVALNGADIAAICGQVSQECPKRPTTSPFREKTQRVDVAMWPSPGPAPIPPPQGPSDDSRTSKLPGPASMPAVVVFPLPARRQRGRPTTPRRTDPHDGDGLQHRRPSPRALPRPALVCDTERQVRQVTQALRFGGVPHALNSGLLRSASGAHALHCLARRAGL